MTQWTESGTRLNRARVTWTMKKWPHRLWLYEAMTLHPSSILADFISANHLTIVENGEWSSGCFCQLPSSFPLHVIPLCFQALLYPPRVCIGPLCSLPLYCLPNGTYYCHSLLRLVFTCSASLMFAGIIVMLSYILIISNVWSNDSSMCKMHGAHN